MLSTRLKKMINDLRFHKSRSLLSILAMSIGILGAVSVINTYAILQPTLEQGFLATNPVSATVVTTAIDQGFLASVKTLPMIKEAEARKIIYGKVQTGTNKQWRTLVLFIRDDYLHSSIDKIIPKRGNWPPAKGEIVIEQSSLSILNSQDRNIRFKINGSSLHTLRFSGVTQETGLAPGWMDLAVYAYISRETLTQIGQTDDLNLLKTVVSGNRFNKTVIQSKIKKLQQWMTDQGYPALDVIIPEPKKHPHASQMESFLFLQVAFGLLTLAFITAILLSCILVIKMMMSLMANQVREIAVMKAIGASNLQIFNLEKSVEREKDM